MARIPIPTRGQPLDVSYIYQIVDAINELTQQTSSATYKYTSVETSEGIQNMLMTETKAVAAFVDIYSTQTQVTPGTSKSFSYSFKGEYKYAPIVTATPVIIDGTSAGQDISVIITSTTTNRVDGIVTFNSSGNLAVRVNILALGVPN
tara:strand:+ start:6222 stop:6665 length:444 start_codon:yes stop_codon:yes gene_type:complete